MILMVILVSLIIGVGTSYWAYMKGRDPKGWFFFALLFPIIAPITLFFLSAVTHFSCKHCGCEIHGTATFCRQCGNRVREKFTRADGKTYKDAFLHGSIDTEEYKDYVDKTYAMYEAVKMRMNEGKKPPTKTVGQVSHHRMKAEKSTQSNNDS
ncbi:MAG: hypothetical protein ACNI27_03150 [Desulfovibrio sp.]